MRDLRKAREKYRQIVYKRVRTEQKHKNKKLYEGAQTYTFPQSLSELKALNIYLMFQMEEPLEPRSDDV